MKELIKSSFIHVIIGYPQHPIRFFSHYFPSHPAERLLFAEKLPFLACLLPLTAVTKPLGASLLRELSHFAERHADRLLTLDTASPEAAAFVEANREALEPFYRIGFCPDPKNH